MKQRKGFAVMSSEQRKAIASKGGKAAHAQGTAHQWTKEEATKAGSKGGKISKGGRGRHWNPKPVSEHIQDLDVLTTKEIDCGV
jgi:uncharacterized protein